MMIVDAVGTCAFCGQTQVLRASDVLSQAEIDDMATRDCICTEARKSRAMEELETSIGTALGADCLGAGMDYQVEDDEIEEVRRLGEKIWNGNIREATMVERWGDTIKLRRKDNRILLTRIHRKQIQL